MGGATCRRRRPERSPSARRRACTSWWDRPIDGAALVDHHGVAGAWQFAGTGGDGTVTVAFVDGDLWQAAAAIGPACAGGGGPAPQWAGPLERVDAFRWDWFATLTPQ